MALGAVALDVSLRTRARRLAAAQALDEGRARAMALAGTEYARARLGSAVMGRAEELRSEVRTTRSRQSVAERVLQAMGSSSYAAEDPWREPLTLVEATGTFADGAYALHLRDTGAALNLNYATEDMLRQFFAQGLRVDYGLADRLAQGILDWRDEDDILLLNGGEREAYLADGAPVLPANRPFDELEELRWVRGMTEEIYAAARPYLTLTSSGRVNVNAAPEPVLLALPGMTAGGATELVRLRDGGVLPRRTNDLEEILSAGAWAAIAELENEFSRRVTYSTDEVEIVSDGWIEGSPVRVRAVVVVSRGVTGATVVWRKADR